MYHFHTLQKSEILVSVQLDLEELFDGLFELDLFFLSANHPLQSENGVSEGLPLQTHFPSIVVSLYAKNGGSIVIWPKSLELRDTEGFVPVFRCFKIHFVEVRFRNVLYMERVLVLVFERENTLRGQIRIVEVNSELLNSLDLGLFQNFGSAVYQRKQDRGMMLFGSDEIAVSGQDVEISRVYKSIGEDKARMAESSHLIYRLLGEFPP